MAGLAVCILSYTVLCMLICQDLAHDAYLDSCIESPGDDRGIARAPDAFLGILVVEGTSISTPVALPRDGQPEGWYLSHSLLGQPEPAGCPYLDPRSMPMLQHLMVFGHHISGTHEGFSDLADCYRQDRLDALGTAMLTLRDGRALRFEPLCGLKVDQGYQSIQRFSFLDTDDLGRWLEQVCEEAAATRQFDKKEQVTNVLTLITCSEDQPGRRGRTLVLFVAGAGYES